MFEKIEVWRCSADKQYVFVFVCFRDVMSGKHYVQSIDALRSKDSSVEISNIRKNTIDLFLETEISVRSRGFAELADAVDDAMKWGEVS